MTACVYLLHDHKPRYIGVSNNLPQRLKNHAHESYQAGGKSYPLPKSRWIRSIGGKFSHRVLFRGTEAECYRMERHYIEAGRQRGWALLNITDGGDRPMPINTHPNYSGIREKIRAKALGRVASASTKGRMSLSHKALPKAHLDKFRGARSMNGRSKPIKQLSLDGHLLKVWPCMKDAAEAVGVSSISLSGAALGRQHTSAGFRWAYL